MSEIEEVAKAAAEASKFGTKALDTTQKLASFVARVFQQPVDDAVGIVGDRLKFMRWQRLIRLSDRVNDILKQRGVQETRAVLPKLALPIFENASLEEDDELHDLWVKLLANSMDPKVNNEIRFAFLEIIKSLNPVDVRILHVAYISLAHGEVQWDKITDYNFKKEHICALLAVSHEDYQLSIYNLFRVQCLAPAIIKTIGVTVGDEPFTIYKGTDAVVMTPLGKSFVEACIK